MSYHVAGTTARPVELCTDRLKRHTTQLRVDRSKDFVLAIKPSIQTPTGCNFTKVQREIAPNVEQHIEAELSHPEHADLRRQYQENPQRLRTWVQHVLEGLGGRYTASKKTVCKLEGSDRSDSGVICEIAIQIPKRKLLSNDPLPVVRTPIAPTPPVPATPSPVLDSGVSSETEAKWTKLGEALQEKRPLEVEKLLNLALASDLSIDDLNEIAFQCADAAPDAVLTRAPTDSELNSYVRCIRAEIEPTTSKEKGSKYQDPTTWMIFGGTAVAVGTLVFLMRR